jgi:type 1 glutamine amidotransferase
MIDRRHWMSATGATAATLVGLPWLRADVQPKPLKRVLVFTRSAGHQHEVVELNLGSCIVHDILAALGQQHRFEVDCTKDGRCFVPEILEKYDAFFFYTTGDLTATKSADGFPPMPKEGKKALLDAIAAGKGFVGSHCATDTFHSPGELRQTQLPNDRDPYISMLGGEFISHGDQQFATMGVVDERFPGLHGVKDFAPKEEWYSLKNFQLDLHVILVQVTKGMKGHDYDRPSFPATWARMHGKGRVFYTSMGHRQDIWTKPLFQNLLVGALNWATGRVDHDISPNLTAVSPQAMTMPPPPPPKDDKKK